MPRVQIMQYVIRIACHKGEETNKSDVYIYIYIWIYINRLRM